MRCGTFRENTFGFGERLCDKLPWVSLPPSIDRMVLGQVHREQSAVANLEGMKRAAEAGKGASKVP